MDLDTSGMIFVGIRGTALALERATGEEIWRTELKGADFVNLEVEAGGNNLYATARGEIFCLDQATGEILWHNPLKGLGYGLVAIAMPDSPGRNNGLLAAEKARREAAAAAAASAAAT